ncbi:MAG: aminotransferase class IV [Candidatus Marinimicrobia bacterium]|nr:aminotransferase class IV [Candidatus Neomarinimicrobiota bacterium]
MKNKYTPDQDKFPFFETIRVSGGLVEQADLHLERMRRTCFFHYGAFHFERIFDKLKASENGIIKLNIWYNQHETEIKVSEYVPAELKTIKVVACDPDFDYSFKYSNRSYLNSLLQSASGADEIVIVKSEMVTDTSKANIVFEKDGVFYTPDTFLLNGTMRQFLITTGKVTEKAIKAEDISEYERMYFINAMNPLESALGFECFRM